MVSELSTVFGLSEVALKTYSALESWQTNFCRKEVGNEEGVHHATASRSR